ncbi:MAG: sulfatase [Rikenellaceae bacterium]
MNRYIICGALSLSVTTVFCAKQSQPNILLFIADDHGFEQCEPYGADYVQTPNIAKMAEQGLVFDRAYVASPASGPSRAALLSGLGSARNGAISNHQVPTQESQTMVNLLQAEGYEVVSIGKVAHNMQHPLLCGFDYLDIEASADEIATSVERYLDGRTSEKPLCLIVGDRRPHVPWSDNTIYDPDEVEVPSYLIDTPMTREHWARYLGDITAMDSMLGDVKALFEDYLDDDNYLSIYTADHGAQWAFGKWNLYERGVRTPLIACWNGNIKPGVRTDAMVSWIDIMPTLIDIAGGDAPRDIDGYSFADILSNPKKRHRKEIYTTHTSDGKMNIYPIRAMNDGEFKYIRNLSPNCYHSNHSDIQRKDGAGAYWDEWDELAKSDNHAREVISRYYQRPAEELYNIAEDPFETNNLANDPELSKKLKELSDKLDIWIKKQGDNLGTPLEPYPLSGATPHNFVDYKK